MSLLLKTLILGISVALLGILANALPQAAAIETDIGLGWLFKLRGPRAVPEGVVIVSIDRDSSRHFGLPNSPRKWPRSYHAKLLRRLKALQVRVVAFDIIFSEAREAAGDQAFAEAIRKSGNVILFQYLEQDRIPAADGQAMIIENLLSPIPKLAEAAAGLAPFPLPKVPAKVDQVQLFKRGAGDAPTLPVVAFQHYMLAYWDQLRGLIQTHLPASAMAHLDAVQADTTAFTTALQQLMQSRPDLVSALWTASNTYREPERSAMQALLALYGGSQSRYLDFYGPPQSIPTIPYYQLLEESPDAWPALAGKAIFVGFSEQFQPEQKDGFYTVFSRPDGLDVSGVEIAATTFANLLEARSVQPLKAMPAVALLAVWGLLVSAAFLWLPGLLPVMAAAGLAVSGVFAAEHLFASKAIWLPLVVPLLLQLPVALIAALTWRHLSARRERRQLREAFGYFLPGQVVDDLIADSGAIATQGQLVNGVCMATDAEQYSRVSEDLSPGELKRLLDSYYQILFGPVRARGGFISDVIGDAMLAIWASTASYPSMREQACTAALEIVAAIEAFNRSASGYRLPTRIGLHGGELLLGHVGAKDHYEYRAVGDIVNAASRIEGLNKQLGTRVLASSGIVAGLDKFHTRALGRFRLVGKRRPLTIHELVGHQHQVQSDTRQLHQGFEQALRSFHAARWLEAKHGFQALLEHFNEDGPSSFYLNLCERHLQQPPPEPWDGVVGLVRK